MRNIGPFEKKQSRDDTRPRNKWPKPDFVLCTLAAEELHAYYVALISSRSLAVDTKGLKLKA